MSNKRYAKFKKFIKEYYKFILFIIVFQIILLFPIPYVINTSGGLLDASKRIIVEDGYKSKGSFHLCYVNEIKANVSTLIMSLFNKDWDFIKVEEVKYDHETLEDAEYRSRLLLKQASQTAVMVAYKKANKEIKINNTNFFIAYIDENVDSNLKIGDELLKINNKKINEYNQILDIIDKCDVDDILTLTIKRDNKTLEIETKVYEINGEKRIGLLLIPIYDFTTNPEVKFVNKTQESGSSGGLMTTLEIYNNLIKEDITRGKKIAGTGTIDVNGNVGEISGVKYKLAGAVKEDADVFLVPSGDNYKEAIKEQKEHDYDIDIVEIKTFDDAIDYLKKI